MTKFDEFGLPIPKQIPPIPKTKSSETKMNERIRECWLKAAREDSGEKWDTQEEFIERFARLIVWECAALCDQATTENRLTKSALPENLTTITEELILSGAMAQSEKLSVRIKQHFGVE